MAMQEALAVMRGQPLREEFSALGHVALLEHRMRKAMRSIGVYRSQRHRAFAQSAAGAEIPGFGMRPAQITREPPVLAIMPGDAFAHRELGGVVVGASGKSVQ